MWDIKWYFYNKHFQSHLLSVSSSYSMILLGTELQRMTVSCGILTTLSKCFLRSLTVVRGSILRYLPDWSIRSPDFESLSKRSRSLRSRTLKQRPTVYKYLQSLPYDHSVWLSFRVTFKIPNKICAIIKILMGLTYSNQLLYNTNIINFTAYEQS